MQGHFQCGMTNPGYRVDFCEPYRQTLNSPVRRIWASTMSPASPSQARRSRLRKRTLHDLVIVIRDQGKGLDASKIPDPLSPDNLLKTSGRGIFLIRSFMDVVEIHPSQTGTELRMTKHVHGNPADSKEAPQ